MNIAIITAMPEEAAPFQDYMTPHHAETTRYGNLQHKGTLGAHNIHLLCCGIGKTNAAMATAALLEHNAFDLVINLGSAGGLNPERSIGDVIIGERLQYHDVDVQAFGYDFGQVPNHPTFYQSNENWVACAQEAAEACTDLRTVKGSIASGDVFLSDPERVAFIKDNIPHLEAIEMEACAIAQVCHAYQQPFLVIRALSDIAGQEAATSFTHNLKKASENASALAHALLTKTA